MNFMGPIVGRLRAGVAWLALFVAGAQLAAQTPPVYNVGNVVTNNFTLQNRLRWTNDQGRVFAPTNSFQLSDFEGKIVFFVFFDVW